MKLSGAEIVIKLLEAENVKYIAGIPGGFNLPLYDALSKSTIKHILARHEQGAYDYNGQPELQKRQSTEDK